MNNKNNNWEHITTQRIFQMGFIQLITLLNVFEVSRQQTD